MHTAVFLLTSPENINMQNTYSAFFDNLGIIQYQTAINKLVLFTLSCTPLLKHLSPL